MLTPTTESKVPTFNRAKFQAAVHELLPVVKNAIRTIAEKHDVNPIHLAGILVSQLILNAFKVPREYEVKSAGTNNGI